MRRRFTTYLNDLSAGDLAMKPLWLMFAGAALVSGCVDTSETRSSGGGGGAPAEVQVACAEEGDRYWGVASGTTVPMGAKSTGGGMYEVTLSAGPKRGICTVTADGNVKSIMNQ
jgi:hypothetical protein